MRSASRLVRALRVLWECFQISGHREVPACRPGRSGQGHGQDKSVNGRHAHLPQSTRQKYVCMHKLFHQPLATHVQPGRMLSGWVLPATITTISGFMLSILGLQPGLLSYCLSVVLFIASTTLLQVCQMCCGSRPKNQFWHARTKAKQICMHADLPLLLCLLMNQPSHDAWALLLL